jgi:23S rRNA (pseudouridine1915-N3)-methyltransferase
MRIVVAAVGRLKQGPERELCERYRKRAADTGRGIGLRGIEIVEVRESRARDAATRILEESIAIANLVPDDAAAVVLDEHGDVLDSMTLSRTIGEWRDRGEGTVIFMIGGADGIADTLREKARLRLSFGKATWPHQLVRVMLLEQLYRAATLLSGHPYHRA